MDDSQKITDEEIQEFFSSLTKIEDDVARIWIRQIETGRVHSGKAIVALAKRFDVMVRNLEDAVKASHTSSSRHGGKNVMAVLQSGESKLRSVVSSLEAAMVHKEALLKQVEKLVTYIQDLKGMAAAVASLADKTDTLALKAAGEAARAGDSGRGFAVVAAQVRSLAKKSGETGQAISDRVKIISTAIAGAFYMAEVFASEDSRRVVNAEQDINAALKDFRQLTDYLEVSDDVLRNSTEEHANQGSANRTNPNHPMT